MPYSHQIFYDCGNRARAISCLDEGPWLRTRAPYRRRKIHPHVIGEGQRFVSIEFKSVCLYFAKTASGEDVSAWHVDIGWNDRPDGTRNTGASEKLHYCSKCGYFDLHAQNPATHDILDNLISPRENYANYPIVCESVCNRKSKKVAPALPEGSIVLEVPASSCGIELVSLIDELGDPCKRLMSSVCDLPQV